MFFGFPHGAESTVVVVDVILKMKQVCIVIRLKWCKWRVYSRKMTVKVLRLKIFLFVVTDASSHHSDTKCTKSLFVRALIHKINSLFP